MSYINTRTKKDITLEKMANLGGKRTTREWAKSLNVDVKDISNALYTEPELQKKYIIKERNRSVHKMPIQEIINKLKANGVERLTCEEMAKVTGYRKSQIRSLLKHPEIKKYYTRVEIIKDEEILSKFYPHWFGKPRFITDWAILTGLDTSTIRRKRNLIEDVYGDVLLDKTKWRVQEIHKKAGQLTLTEWSEYFGIDITAMHHFFTRKRLHHLRKNPPEKHLITE